MRAVSQPARQQRAVRYDSAVLNVSTPGKRERESSVKRENKETAGSPALSRPPGPSLSSPPSSHPCPPPRAPYRGTMLFYGAVSLSLFHPATRWSWRWRWFVAQWFLANRHTLVTASASTSVSLYLSLSLSLTHSLPPPLLQRATFNLIKRGLYRTAR